MAMKICIHCGKPVVKPPKKIVFKGKLYEFGGFERVSLTAFNESVTDVYACYDVGQSCTDFFGSHPGWCCTGNCGAGTCIP